MMPLSEIFFLGIVLLLLYRFVFNFFVPIVRTTRQVRQQFRNMQDSMQNPGGPYQQQSQQQSYTRPREEAQPKKKETPTSSNTMGEYIDFEEVK